MCVRPASSRGRAGARGRGRAGARSFDTRDIDGRSLREKGNNTWCQQQLTRTLTQQSSELHVQLTAARGHAHRLSQARGAPTRRLCDVLPGVIAPELVQLAACRQLGVPTIQWFALMADRRVSVRRRRRGCGAATAGGHRSATAAPSRRLLRLAQPPPPSGLHIPSPLDVRGRVGGREDDHLVLPHERGHTCTRASEAQPRQLESRTNAPRAGWRGR